MTFIRSAVIVDSVAHELNRRPERLLLKAANGSAALSGPNIPFAPLTVATAIGTAAKTTTSAEPAANTLVPIKFTNGNSAASATIAFAGGAARAIQLGGSAPTAAELTLAANGVAMFWFDGTILHQLGVYA